MLGVVAVELPRQGTPPFLDCANGTLGVAVLPGFAPISYANLNLSVLKDLGVACGCGLGPLVRMVTLWNGFLVGARR
jgi:hypothetical protein